MTLLYVTFFSLFHLTQSLTERIYLPRRSQHEEPLWILTSLLSEANFALLECFVDDLLPSKEAKARCCAAISTSSVHVMDRAQVQRACKSHLLMELPITQAAQQPRIGYEQRLPRFALLERQSISDESYSSTKEIGMENVFNYFVWDDAIQLGFWIPSKETNHNVYNKTSFLYKNEQQDRPTFVAQLTSTLSRYGGMHRKLHTFISITVPSAILDSRKHSVNSRCSLDLWMLLYLPPDLYLNVEDAFEESHLDLTIVTAWNTETGRPLIINEEEPAFVSPPHAIYVRIQDLKQKCSLQQPLELQFDIKLHLRYPKPLSSGDDWTTIWLLSPELAAGQLVVVEEGLPTTSAVLQARGHQRSPALSTQVAVGNEQDYGYAVVVTLVVAFWGMIALLRAMNMIIKWV